MHIVELQMIFRAALVAIVIAAVMSVSVMTFSVG